MPEPIWTLPNLDWWIVKIFIFVPQQQELESHKIMVEAKEQAAEVLVVALTVVGAEGFNSKDSSDSRKLRSYEIHFHRIS